MSHVRHFLVILLAAAPAPAAEPRRDPYGDPLPTGAVARIGTARLRHAGSGPQVSSVAFSPDGKSLASAGRDSVCVWEAATGKQLLEVKADYGPTAVAFSPDGKAIAVGLWDGGVRVLAAATGQQRVELKLRLNQVYAVAYSPDGKVLAAAGNRVGLLDAATGKELQAL